MRSVPSAVNTATCLTIRRSELSFLHKNMSHVAADRMPELDSSFRWLAPHSEVCVTLACWNWSSSSWSCLQEKKLVLDTAPHLKSLPKVTSGTVGTRVPVRIRNRWHRWWYRWVHAVATERGNSWRWWWGGIDSVAGNGCMLVATAFLIAQFLFPAPFSSAIRKPYLKHVFNLYLP